jgi:hypothetical protein
MDQATQPAKLCELFQMLAWLAKAGSAHANRGNPKFTIYQMIQWNTRSNNIAPGVRRRQLDPGPLSRGIDHSAEERLDSL